MRVTITGKTASTITFNTLGIVLRGQVSAIHIDIVDEHQLREVITLKNAGLIDIQSEDIIEKKSELSVSSISKEVDVTEDVDGDVSEDVEDSPSKNIEKTEAIVKKTRGRPKGWKKQVTKEQQKTENVENTEKKTIKRVESKVDNKPKSSEGREDSFVMTSQGPRKAMASNSLSGEIKDSELTRASIESLKKMEDESSKSEADIAFVSHKDEAVLKKEDDILSQAFLDDNDDIHTSVDSSFLEI